MSRRARSRLLGVLALVAVVAGFVLIQRGTVVSGGIWLDGEPDQASRDVAVFIFGECSGRDEVVESLSIEETEEAVIIDLKIRVSFHLGGREDGGSCEGMPYVLHLDRPLGDRVILILNPDSSTSPIQVSPY